MPPHHISLLAFGALVATAATLLAANSRAAAQPDPSDTSAGPSISADSPGFTNVTSAAPELVLVTEQSLSLQRAPGSITIALPGLLARLGLVPDLELRAVLPSVLVTAVDGADTQVDTDTVGLGGLFAAQLTARLSASLAPTLAIPLGLPDGGPSDLDAWLQGNLSWAASSQVNIDLGALGGIVQVPGPTGPEARGRLLAGLLVGLALSPWTSLYGEGHVHCIAETDCLPTLGGGGAHWLSPNLQVHLASSLTLGDSTAGTLALGSVVRWW